MTSGAKKWGAIWLVVLVAFCVCFAKHGAARQLPSNDKVAPSLVEIVERLAQAQQQNHEAARSYTVVRNYELVNGSKPESSSQVQAEVSYSPPGTKEYAIRATTGGRGERVVRRVLEHEAEMASSWRKVALLEENYHFALLGEETVAGHECFVLSLTPRSDYKDLIRGRAWIDAENFNVRRIEGAPLKTPSWWVKRLEITMQFSQVMGMWLQTAFVAKAEVRFFGEQTLTAQDVQLRTGELVGSATKSAEGTQSWQLNGAGNSPAMVGAGVLSMPWHEVR